MPIFLEDIYPKKERFAVQTTATQRKRRSRLRGNRGVTDLILFGAALPALVIMLAGALDVARRVLIMRDLREAIVSGATMIANVKVLEDAGLHGSFPAANLLCTHVPGNTGDCTLSNAEQSLSILSSFTASAIADTACGLTMKKLGDKRQLFTYDPQSMILSVGIISWGSAGPHQWIGGAAEDPPCGPAEREDEALVEIYNLLQNRHAEKNFGAASPTAIPAAYIVFVATVNQESLGGTFLSFTNQKVQAVYVHALPELAGIQLPT